MLSVAHCEERVAVEEREGEKEAKIMWAPIEHQLVVLVVLTDIQKISRFQAQTKNETHCCNIIDEKEKRIKQCSKDYRVPLIIIQIE